MPNCNQDKRLRTRSCASLKAGIRGSLFASSLFSSLVSSPAQTFARTLSLPQWRIAVTWNSSQMKYIFWVQGQMKVSQGLNLDYRHSVASITQLSNVDLTPNNNLRPRVVTRLSRVKLTQSWITSYIRAFSFTRTTQVRYCTRDHLSLSLYFSVNFSISHLRRFSSDEYWQIFLNLKIIEIMTANVIVVEAGLLSNLANKIFKNVW